MANYNLDLFLFIHAPSTYTLMTISNPPLGRLRFVNSTETLPMLLSSPRQHRTLLLTSLTENDPYPRSSLA